MNRGREQFEKENQILADHLKIEAQIRKVEEMDQKKREVIAALARVRLPGVVPCDMIDQKSVVAKRKEEQAAEANKGANSLYAKVGIPAGQSTTGVYFLSNAMSQDPPLNQPLVEQMKIMYEALDINPNELFPSSRVYEKLHEINQQMLVMFQLKHMIDEKKQDFEMLKEKEEQIEQVVNAQTWNIKEMLDQKLKDKVAYTARQALPEPIAIQNGLCSAMNQQT